MAIRFERQCPECGKVNFFQQSQALFCPPAEGQNSPSCKRAWNNRNLGQGGPLVPYLKAWRKSRHGVKGDPIGSIVLGDICSAIDKFIEQDRKAGRPDPVHIIKERYRMQGVAGILVAPPMNKKPAKKEAA